MVRLTPVWMTNHPPSVLWHCWLGHQTCKNRRPYNLYCVGADVKPCSINQSTSGGVWNRPVCNFRTFIALTLVRVIQKTIVYITLDLYLHTKFRSFKSEKLLWTDAGRTYVQMDRRTDKHWDRLIGPLTSRSHLSSNLISHMSGCNFFVSYLSSPPSQFCLFTPYFLSLHTDCFHVATDFRRFLCLCNLLRKIPSRIIIHVNCILCLVFSYFFAMDTRDKLSIFLWPS